MIKYDLRNGILNRKGWFLPIFFWGIAVCFVRFYLETDDNLSFGSCLFIVLAGCEPVDIGQKSFTLPVLWMFLQLGYMFFTIEYPTRDMNIFGQQIMVRSGRRRNWLISKTIWLTSSIVIYWGIGWLIISLFCVINGLPISLCIDGELPPSVLPSCDIYADAYHASKTVVPLMIAPVAASLTVALIQMMLAVLLNEILAASVSIFFIVWSACVKTPFALENYAMMERCDLFCTNGLSFSKGLALMLCVSVGVTVISLILFTMKDILEPKKNGT